MPKQNWEEKADEKISEFAITNNVAYERVEALVLYVQHLTEQEVKNKILKSLPKITTHICRFNDGDCVCRCFESAINETKKAINKI